MMRERLITLAFVAAAAFIAYGAWLAYPPFEGTVERDVRREIR
jgi:hypothetical protein